MNKFFDFLNSVYKEVISWFSYESIESTFSIVSHWFFQASYYVGIGTGMIISMVILAPLLNRLLTRLTYHYETTTFGQVPNPPKLTKSQIELLKETLFWWNKQCDSWYITDSACVDKALNGQEINLVDVRRIRDATQVGHMCGKKPPPKAKTAFNKFEQVLAQAEKELSAEVSFKKSRKKLVQEMDVMTKQLKIAQYSAIAAIASACATAFLAYITYKNL